MIVFLLTMFLAQSAPPAAGKLGTYGGRVLHSRTQAPLGGVALTLENMNLGTPAEATTTGDDGRFEFKDVNPGRYWVRAKLKGYTLADTEWGVAPALQLVPGEVFVDNKLLMDEEATLSGRVFDSNGDPAEFVTVEVEKGQQWFGRRVTNDRGEFKITGLTPGFYVVRAAPPVVRTPPDIRADGRPDTTLVETFYPDATDRKGATRIEVKAGARVEAIDIRLARHRVVGITGRITGHPPGARNLFLLLTRDGQAVNTGTRPKDGEFAIWRLAPGRYSLAVLCHGEPCSKSNTAMMSAPLEFELAASSLENVELAMVAPFPVRGQVVWEKPPDGVKLDKAVLGLAPPPGLLWHPAKWAADGAFEIANASPGKYWFSVATPPGDTSFPLSTYVKSVRLGSQPFTSMLELRSPPGDQTLTVTLSTAAAEVGGLVQDAKGPVAGALVVLQPVDPEWVPRGFYATTDAAGRYRITGVRPGEYRLGRMDASERGAFLRGVSHGPREAVGVSPKESDKLQVDLRVH